MRNHLGHLTTCLYRTWTLEENPSCDCLVKSSPVDNPSELTMSCDGHLVTITHTSGVRPYHAVCSCGWVAAKLRYGQHNAEDDGARHLLVFRK
jgi:hypothetical protein